MEKKTNKSFFPTVGVKLVVSENAMGRSIEKFFIFISNSLKVFNRSSYSNFSFDWLNFFVGSEFETTLVYCNDIVTQHSLVCICPNYNFFFFKSVM